MVCVFYNPVAGSRAFEKIKKEIDGLYKNEDIQYYDVISTDDLMEHIDSMSADDRIVVCGGDGTLNNFINRVRLGDIKQDIYHFPAGTGNDFCNDIDISRSEKIYRINDYLKCLPVLRTKGVERLFINGIGFGVDGYCCAEGNKIRSEHPGKRVNYGLIAFKGILYGYKKTNAKVRVDGMEMQFRDVWMACTMNGRFFGRKIMCAPNQDRMNDDGILSLVIIHSRYRFPLIGAFVSIYKGNHIKYDKMVKVIKGSNISVEFDKPTALQIDGDTILDVLKYEVHKDKNI